MRAVVGIERIVDRILRQFGVQFASLAIRILPVVIVDTVGDVARLLDLSNEATGTDGMYTTCGQEEYITIFR